MQCNTKNVTLPLGSRKLKASAVYTAKCTINAWDAIGRRGHPQHSGQLTCKQQSFQRNSYRLKANDRTTIRRTTTTVTLRQTAMQIFFYNHRQQQLCASQFVTTVIGKIYSKMIHASKFMPVKQIKSRASLPKPTSSRAI